MEVVRCARCGVFFTSGGYVCSKCQSKDDQELSAFKDFMEKNGSNCNTLSEVCNETGIALSNLNRFLDYEGLKSYKKLFN